MKSELHAYLSQVENARLKVAQAPWMFGGSLAKYRRAILIRPSSFWWLAGETGWLERCSC